MDSTFLIIFEFGIFLASIILFFKAFEAFDLSQIFKKGYSQQIRIIYITFVIIAAYFLTQAVMMLFTIFNNIQGI